jgi:hypothetical protein
MDNSYKLIQAIKFPTTVKGLRGLFHDSTGTHLYLPNYGTSNIGDTTSARLLSYNLSTHSVTYDKSYAFAAIDRACLSTDDTTIYAPAGENVQTGSYDRSWYVITAASGIQTSMVNLANGVVRPHNTQCAPGFVFMAAVDVNSGAASHHSVTMYNTSTHVQTNIGPFTAGTGRIRPFVVDVPHGLVYVNLEDWIGFAVASTSGRVLYDAQKPPGYVEPGTTNVVSSHGIAVTPDGNHLYVSDPNMKKGSSTANGVEVWDVSGVRSGSAPVYKTFIRTSSDPNVYSGLNPGWLAVTNSGAHRHRDRRGYQHDY